MQGLKQRHCLTPALKEAEMGRWAFWAEGTYMQVWGSSWCRPTSEVRCSLLGGGGRRGMEPPLR